MRAVADRFPATRCPASARAFPVVYDGAQAPARVGLRLGGTGRRFHSCGIQCHSRVRRAAHYAGTIGAAQRNGGCLLPVYHQLRAAVAARLDYFCATSFWNSGRLCRETKLWLVAAFLRKSAALGCLASRCALKSNALPRDRSASLLLPSCACVVARSYQASALSGVIFTSRCKTASNRVPCLSWTYAPATESKMV